MNSSQTPIGTAGWDFEARPPGPSDYIPGESKAERDTGLPQAHLTHQKQKETETQVFRDFKQVFFCVVSLPSALIIKV